MRARSSAILSAALLSLLLPAAASAQGSGIWAVADNPSVDCELPLPATMVTGELGTYLWVADAAEIDKVTIASESYLEIVDTNWHEHGHDAEITTSADVTAYIVWSCAPMNGEPVQQNDPQEV